MLRSLLRGTRLGARVRAALGGSAEDALKPLRKEIRRLSRDVEALQEALRDTAVRAARGDRAAAQLRLMFDLNEHQRARIASLPELLDEGAIYTHVSRAIAGAALEAEPFEHVVVDDVLPPAVYELLLAALPPQPFFDDHDPYKLDMHFPMTFGPTLAMTVWNFVDGVLARRIVQPVLLDRFHEPLQNHFDTVFGPSFRERANALPYLSSGGRLMLRRAGYHLDPHRDPKRSMLTCLLYLARPGDSEVHGTQLFRVIGDREANYKQTYYPEADGQQCELAEVVSFRPNRRLAFLNSRGAHGATIPADAGPGLERYSYQFYVAPENGALGTLIRDLPRDRRVMWQNKNKLTD